ncbi:MAG: S-methyl-5'-thioadenosine phosphorylase [Euryarchaeota archaeon]|nr:S-methyl-5'-thioadenosine phosphorylase [Euryarchaeota archaeon]
MKPEIAFIGGTGMDVPTLLEDPAEVLIDTPFGPPSSAIVLGEIKGQSCAFLSRHGAGHHLSPSHVPYQANIYALKTLGVRTIIAVSAVGSLRQTIRPLDIFIPNQIYDRTKLRPNTFFTDFCVHVSFADPFCKDVCDSLRETGQGLGISVKTGGVYVCIEGPRFSTRAESNVYRQMGFDVIGMTAMPEAILAREAEMCYGMLATVTDYDVWHEEDVTIQTVMRNVSKNVQNTQRIIEKVVPLLSKKRQTCQCDQALKDAIVTNKAYIPERVKDKLRPITGDYI